MKAGFLEKLIERLGRIGPEDVQNYFLRLAQEKGFLETVFNAIQEGIIVTDSKGRMTYLNDAACALFGLEAGEAIGKRLDERIGGLDWESLTQSGGPVSHDVEIFYPQNRFINFYVVPLVMEPREIVVEQELRSDLPLLQIDRDQMKQAFYNVIKNSIEAMHRHGMLRIRTDLDDTHVIVRFVDTGGGMSAENLSRVFEPYFTTKASGSGLGLLIVRRIVREQGGELSIESSQGRGVTLTIRLPFVDKRIRMLEAGEARDQKSQA